MDDTYIEDGVRERLIIAGINELSEHGISDFSLRRTAQRAEVSCAAPYRHFKDKDDLIFGMCQYIISKWELLCREILEAYSTDSRRAVLEVSVAIVRFFSANANFRSFLTLPSFYERCDFDAYLDLAIKKYVDESGITSRLSMISYAVKTEIYGMVMLVAMNKIGVDEAVSLLRRIVSTYVM